MFSRSDWCSGSEAHAMPPLFVGARSAVTLWVLYIYILYRGFHKWGYPIAGWFIIENPSKNGWFAGTPILGTHHIYIYVHINAHTHTQTHRHKKMMHPLSYTWMAYNGNEHGVSACGKCIQHLLFETSTMQDVSTSEGVQGQWYPSG